MQTEVLAIRILPEEKRALKVLALEADLTLTDFILSILREHTSLTPKAVSLAEINSQMTGNLSQEIGHHVA